jgi:uncharacterized membrane protein YdjX (TVP38/TMEM64 family)
VGWVALFVAALAAVWMAVVFRQEIRDWWSATASTFASAEEFRDWVEGLGAWGPLAYVLVQALQVILAPIPGTLLPPVGALAFGPWPAFFLSLAGLALGSAVVFLAARRWGRPLAVRMFGEERIHRYEQVMTARGGLLLWLIFLLPLLPDDMVCALAGLSGIAFQRFMVIAVVGRIPAVATGVFTMAGLEGSPAWVWALATVVALSALLVGLRYREALESRLLRVMRRQAHVERTPAPSQPTMPATAPPDLVRGDEAARQDPLLTVLAVVVVITTVAVLVAVLTGVSGLASGIVLVWGVALAVVVSWGREDD